MKTTKITESKRQNYLAKWLVCTLLIGTSAGLFGETPADSKSSKGSAKQSADDRAIDLVMNCKQVKDWMKLFNGPGHTSKLGGHAGFNVVDHKGEVYTVQAVEDLPDRQVTFQFYEVNIRTGKVTTQS